jgi:hypothetical protein
VREVVGPVRVHCNCVDLSIEQREGQCTATSVGCGDWHTLITNCQGQPKTRLLYDGAIHYVGASNLCSVRKLCNYVEFCR